MKVVVGPQGLKETQQQDFPAETKCHNCGGVARHAFTAFEDTNEGGGDPTYVPNYVCRLHTNDPQGFWLHDLCSVAVYFCKQCGSPMARFNQG